MAGESPRERQKEKVAAAAFSFLFFSLFSLRPSLFSPFYRVFFQ